MSRAPRLPKALACLVLSLAASVAMADDDGAAPAKGILGPMPGAYARAVTLRPDDSGPSLEYRFQGQERWFAFDRALQLSAFKGEERRYSIEFRSGPASKAFRLDYAIDRAPPPVPSFSTPSGDVGPSLSVVPFGTGSIYLSVDGSPFAKFSGARPSVFQAKARGTTIVEAAAYAVDELGNASEAAYGTWRLHPDGFTPSFRFAPPPSPVKLIEAGSGDGLEASIVDLAGSAKLVIVAPRNAVPCAAINPPEPLADASAFVELPVDGALIQFPWGYERGLKLYYGYKLDGELRYRPEPLALVPSFPEAQEAPIKVASIAPTLRRIGRAVLLEWPVGTLETWVSIGGDDFVRYEAPFVLASGSEQVCRYYAVGAGGTASEVASIAIPARIDPAPAVVTGVDDGTAYGSTVTLAPPLGSSIRYSIAEGEGLPPPIADDAPILPAEGLPVAGRKGATVRYSARFSALGEGEAMPTETAISFTIDREPPPVPVALKPDLSGGGSDAAIRFGPNPGSLMVSVSEDGKGPFAALAGAAPPFADDEGRKRYIVRAYSEDEFGNRSAEMTPVELLVDRSSVYVDPSGRRGAAGTPDDPFQSIDEAVAAAETNGKRFVYVRGAASLRKAVAIKGRIELRGGFGDGWVDDPSATARIDAAVGTGFAIVVDGGRLSLDKIAVSARVGGSGGIVEVRGGFFDAASSSLSASGGVESAALSAKGSKVSLSQCSVAISGALTGRGIDVDGGSLGLEEVSIACGRDVRAFEALRVVGAQASLAGLRMDCAPDYAFIGFHATRSTARIDRSLISVRGGTSTCKVMVAEASRVDLVSSYVDVAWKGSAELADASAGSSVRMANLTALFDASRSSLLSASGSEWTLANTIAVFSGSVSTLVKADGTPKPGAVSANCLWGFTSLVDGTQPIARLDELNKYAASGYPNILAEPTRVFSGMVKGLRRLAKDSPCVDAGAPFEWISRLDLFGSKRISARGAGRPDIGAEELE